MKKIIYLTLIMLVISIFIINACYGRVDTIEKAIAPSNPHKINIVHEEKIQNGSIVFYNHIDQDDFSTAYVKENIFGFKLIYNGVGGGVSKTLNKRGFVSHYYPYIKNTPLPVHLGMTNNKKIENIKAIDETSNIEVNAKIIDVNNIKLWIIYLEKFKSFNFKVIGYSQNGEILFEEDEKLK